MRYRCARAASGPKRWDWCCQILEGPVFRVWMNKIQEYAFQKGYTVFCCTCGDDAVRCGTILESLAVKNVDGLVITVPSTLEKEDVLTRTLHTLQDNGVPFVLLDRAVYSIFSDFVTSDNKYGGRIAVEKLFQAGASRNRLCVGTGAGLYDQKALPRLPGRNGAA